MQNNTDFLPNAQQVVDFWLDDSVTGPKAAVAQKDRWYRGGPEVDREIRERFAPAVNRALAGSHSNWTATSVGALGLVILLDQFTRTLFRGTAKAFSGDEYALTTLQNVIASDLHRDLPVPGRIFLYHPFHHAESVTAQDRGIELVRDMLGQYPAEWHAYIQQSVDGFTRHRNIVAQFGRFPHRNAVLGRQTTAEEQAYLDGGAERFGQ
jgi:uncharacterized protein (DUF924 family)